MQLCLLFLRFSCTLLWLLKLVTVVLHNELDNNWKEILWIPRSFLFYLKKNEKKKPPVIDVVSSVSFWESSNYFYLFWWVLNTSPYFYMCLVSPDVTSSGWLGSKHQQTNMCVVFVVFACICVFVSSSFAVWMRDA